MNGCKISQFIAIWLHPLVRRKMPGQPGALELARPDTGIQSGDLCMSRLVLEALYHLCYIKHQFRNMIVGGGWGVGGSPPF
jgi:hypothetical protein